MTLRIILGIVQISPLKIMSMHSGFLFKNALQGQGHGPACLTCSVWKDSPLCCHSLRNGMFAKHPMYNKPVLADGESAVHAMGTNCCTLSPWEAETVQGYEQERAVVKHIKEL